MMALTKVLGGTAEHWQFEPERNGLFPPQWTKEWSITKASVMSGLFLDDVMELGLTKSSGDDF